MEERFDSNGNLFLGLGELVVAELKQGREKPARVLQEVKYC